MKPAARARIALCAVAAGCAAGIGWPWLTRDMVEPVFMLVPIAPFVLIALVGNLTKSSMVIRASLLLSIALSGFLLLRLVYLWLLQLEDEWLELNLFVIGTYQIVIAALILGSVLAVERHRAGSGRGG